MVSDNCIIQVTEDNSADQRRLDDLIKKLRDAAKERAENPNNPTEVNEVFENLLNNEIDLQARLANRRSLEGIAKIEARRRNRRVYDAMRQQRRTNTGEERFTPVTAVAETVNQVGETATREGDRAYLGFLFEVENRGYDTFFRNKDNERSILLELGEINKQRGQPGISGSREAQEIARIFQGYMDNARKKMADQGVPIADLEGRMIKNTLSPQSLGRVSRDKFIQDFLYRVDRKKTLDAEEDISDARMRKELGEIYDSIVSGEFRDIPIGQTGAGRRESSLSQRIAKPREIHLNNADDVMFMASEYGPGSARDVMLESLRNNSRMAAIMQEMGPDPRNTLEDLKQRAAQDARDQGNLQDAESILNPDAFTTLKGRNVNAIMDHIDGSSMEGHTTMLRDLGIILRNISSFSLLGKLLFASVPDVGTFQRAQNRVGMEFGGQGKALVDELLANQRLSAEDQKRALGHISAATRMMVHESFELSNNSTLTGRLANRSQHLAHFTFKYSGGQFWQRSMQRAAHTSMSKHMADELQTKRWDQLNQPMQDMLLRSGITENDWVTLQGLNDKLIAKQALDTNDLFLADSVRELSDDVVAVRILNDPEASGRAIRSARNELEQKAQNAIFTFVNDAVIKPDSRTTSALTGGQAAGTLEGFLFRGITNLMSWPYAFTMRAMGNEFEQGGAGAAAKGLFKLQGMMTAYAAFGLAAQDALVENTTRDWLSNDPSVQANNFADIASRSGIGGMYGGWLLGLARYGQSPFALFGPGGDVVGKTLEDVYRSGMELSQGEVEESTARFGQAIENIAPDIPIFQPIFMSAAMNEANNIVNPSYEKISEQAGREPLFETN